ncbi:hypothetical protein GGTG_00358 [Gaeumannomyces tritici R3-111a-1]|uniref:Uncharacterized protein n=1 Tax=Gaeumannomyces tritici (strain R3-111a-1) TaxID=644352 RepID=J3NGG8_GAET3|nr:hypothetical protein GGTG_00358 [Gaeumannomyces tritici R3-111a-1]EJT80358.1 hypothetical protein GGTG_00358 [Gaeumannomyces tritici R3-111a-1]
MSVRPLCSLPTFPSIDTSTRRMHACGEGPDHTGPNHAKDDEGENGPFRDKVPAAPATHRPDNGKRPPLPFRTDPQTVMASCSTTLARRALFAFYCQL